MPLLGWSNQNSESWRKDFFELGCSVLGEGVAWQISPWDFCGGDDFLLGLVAQELKKGVRHLRSITMVCAGLCSQAHCAFLNVEMSWRLEPVAPYLVCSYSVELTSVLG